MTGLPARGYESETTLAKHVKVFLTDLKAWGEIVSFVHIPNEGKRKQAEAKKQAQEVFDKFPTSVQLVSMVGVFSGALEFSKKRGGRGLA